MAIISSFQSKELILQWLLIVLPKRLKPNAVSSLKWYYFNFQTTFYAICCRFWTQIRCVECERWIENSEDWLRKILLVGIIFARIYGRRRSMFHNRLDTNYFFRHPAEETRAPCLLTEYHFLTEVIETIWRGKNSLLIPIQEMVLSGLFDLRYVEHNNGIWIHNSILIRITNVGVLRFWHTSSFCIFRKQREATGLLLTHGTIMNPAERWYF